MKEQIRGFSCVDVSNFSLVIFLSDLALFLLFPGLGTQIYGVFSVDLQQRAIVVGSQDS